MLFWVRLQWHQCPQCPTPNQLYTLASWSRIILLGEQGHTCVSSLSTISQNIGSLGLELGTFGSELKPLTTRTYIPDNKSNIMEELIKKKLKKIELIKLKFVFQPNEFEKYFSNGEFDINTISTYHTEWRVDRWAAKVWRSLFLLWRSICFRSDLCVL